MTKPNGRGRGWRRKEWKDLAPSTKQKYQRLGVNAARHNRGDSPRDVDRWLAHQQAVYGWEDNGDGSWTMYANGVEYTDELPDRGLLLDLIREQRQAEAAYSSGNAARGSMVWENRSPNVPEWMYFYHGVFS